MDNITKKIKSISYEKIDSGALGIAGMILGEMLGEDVKIRKLKVITAIQNEELDFYSAKKNVLTYGKKVKLATCYVLVLIELTIKETILIKIADSSNFKKILKEGGKDK